MSLADQVRTKKRRAVVKSVLPTLLAMLVCVFFPIPGSILLAVIIGKALYSRRILTDKYVIWLRRFHRREPKRLRFNKVLNSACPGLCLPITIQDSVFKMSYLSIKQRVDLLWQFTGVFIPTYFIFAFLVGSGLTVFGIHDHRLTIAYLIASVPIIMLIPFILERFRGYVALSPANSIGEVDYTLQQLPHWKLGFQGVMVFKCPDAVWQMVVGYVISRASAVIIDVSDLTDNVIWELKTSLENNHVESIILTFGLPKDAPEELPKSVRGKLEKAVGQNSLSRLRVFYYPENQPHFWLSRNTLYADLSRRLETELAACIQNASTYIKRADLQQRDSTNGGPVAVSTGAALDKNPRKWWVSHKIFFAIGVFVVIWIGLSVWGLWPLIRLLSRT